MNAPPLLLDRLDELDHVLDVPRLGLMVDFDGTLAPIAPTPDEAAISPVALDALRRIVPVVELVCVISGRAVADLAPRVDLPGAALVGAHGVEFLDGRGLRVEPGAAEYAETIAGVLAHLRSRVDDPAVVWQAKTLAASVHYRLARDPEDSARRLEDALADAPGAGRLESFRGKMVLELVAPLGLDKGHAVRKLARERELDSVLFMGDDTTDAAGMEAVRELRRAGAVLGASIAVLHHDTPDAVLAAADYALPGVPGVERFLAWLAGRVGDAPPRVPA